MKPEEVKNLRSAVDAIHWLMEEREKTLAQIAALEYRIELAEKDRSFMARREPPRVPPFPKILRDYGMFPPEERKGATPT
jgi:hypothetical protein